MARISFCAGPGAGKSTSAAWLFSELKIRSYSVELVSEYVKMWSYQKRTVNEFDQCYIAGKQLYYEYRFLSQGVKNVVTDSPIILSSIYAKINCKDIQISAPLRQIALEFEKKYPSIIIFLERKDKPYFQEGRYQNYEQALELDKLIRKSVVEVFDKEQIFFVDYNDKKKILDIAVNYCSK